MKRRDINRYTVGFLYRVTVVARKTLFYALFCVSSGYLFSHAGMAGEATTLRYHRSVSEEVYQKSPSAYDRLEFELGKGKLTYYVERRAARQILASQIESVIVKKERRYGNSPEEIEARNNMIKDVLRGVIPQSSDTPNAYPSGFFYSMAFTLTPAEWKREITFTNKNVGQTFQMKLGSQHLAIAEFVDPLGAETMHQRQFTIYTTEADQNAITRKLAPILNKVSWR